MAILPNTTKECFQAIKDAIRDKIATLPGDRKTYNRMRYADNLGQWVSIAAVTIDGESRLQTIFIYLSDFATARKEARLSSITASFSIEVIYQFREGDEDDNSTLSFENELGDINDLFLDEVSLGFTDTSSNPVLNLPITGEPDENRGSPVYVDGVLAHRKILTLEVTFRLKRGE
jgi:hypothetical protein